jgi:hypothetical protein
VVPDSAHIAAIPFIDVAVYNSEPTLRTIFHTLVHVTQFAVVGLETAMECYFRVLNESGLWMVVPLEEQAYRMDARYTRDPTDVFSVEEEIREWLRKGRYLKNRRIELVHLKLEPAVVGHSDIAGLWYFRVRRSNQPNENVAIMRLD